MKKILSSICLLLAFLFCLCGCHSPGGDSPGGDGTQEQVATLTFSPGAGTDSALASVTIACATSGATIRYTLDGTTPSDTAGTVYATPVDILATSTLNAIAYKTDMSDSAVATAAYTIVAKIPGFNFLLSQGSHWQYGWKKVVVSWEEGSKSTSSTTTGSCTVTLGAPTMIQGITAYPIVVSGTFPDSYSPKWKYIAISNDRILGSQDGSTLAEIFNGWTGANTGGGFFCPFDSTKMSGAYASGISTTYYTNPNTYALGQFKNTTAGKYYPGIGTIYTGAPSTTNNTVEFFAPGIGPVGFTYFFGYSTSDYETSTKEEMGLTASSF